MPTGYTSDVANGKVTDLRTFALICARGMGACITMRDEPSSTPIPERFEPSDYHEKKIVEAIAERNRLYAMSEAETADAAFAEYTAGLADKQEYYAQKDATRERYEAMIAKVERWRKAPEGLKEDMLDQLRRSIEFDCPRGQDYYRTVELVDGSEWRASKLEKAQRDLEYHTVEDAKERARTDGRNAWIAQLRASLDEMEASE